MAWQESMIDNEKESLGKRCRNSMFLDDVEVRHCGLSLCTILIVMKVTKATHLKVTKHTQDATWFIWRDIDGRQIAK
jgi:hypothetical protein